MTDFAAILANLRRPRLLIRAARFGLQDYRRDRDLPMHPRSERQRDPDRLRTMPTVTPGAFRAPQPVGATPAAQVHKAESDEPGNGPAIAEYAAAIAAAGGQVEVFEYQIGRAHV